MQMDGSLHLDFVDFRDLTWRRAAFPADLHADVQVSRQHEVSPHGGAVCCNRVLAVTLSCHVTFRAQYTTQEGAWYSPPLLPLFLQVTASVEADLEQNAQAFDITAVMKCSPALVRVSQGLVHTTTLSFHMWSGTVFGEAPGSASSPILSHYVICNDTLDSLHVGQVHA